MCFPFDARPPLAPLAGAAVEHEDLTLTSSDGTRFAALLARAERPSAPAVVVLPDVRGLFAFYEELALRFAEAGYDAIAIDYFGRTGGAGKRDEQFPFMEHVAQTKSEQIAADVGAAVAHLRGLRGEGRRAVFTVGFCYGGAHSWMQAAYGHELAGVIGFYGAPVDPLPSGSPSPVDRAKFFTCPVLGLMGGADPYIPQERVDAFGRALTEANVPHEIVVYPGAPHSFFDRTYEQHAKESADAWRRVLEFMQSHA